MNDDQRDLSLFIGLHKLAQQNGDGLVPELYDLLTRRPDELPEGNGILRFPIGRTRPAGQALADAPEASPAKVIPLRRPA
ncbi:hypothetical protein [Rhizobium sp. CSW-27]|uniref:hypothetical protein n=1 Tax=Rhizobium sp. CSW-27 TaxID=2839985 RepID=UPI001C00EA6C|nr:hypothetical protein [Rhizobium sp. CSW-27]MBT9369509.1 hypothetical protein [Rhizobium sp. CSW-27]